MIYERSLASSLSESLTIPSKAIKRRTNEYVKVRPQSREVIEQNPEEVEQNQIEQNSESVTRVVIEHQETAL